MIMRSTSTTASVQAIIFIHFFALCQFIEVQAQDTATKVNDACCLEDWKKLIALTDLSESLKKNFKSTPGKFDEDFKAKFAKWDDEKTNGLGKQFENVCGNLFFFQCNPGQHTCECLDSVYERSGTNCLGKKGAYCNKEWNLGCGAELMCSEGDDGFDVCKGKNNGGKLSYAHGIISFGILGTLALWNFQY